MAAKKRTATVELQVGERVESFEINHAERILKMPNNGGWKLPNDSKYILDNNGLIVRPSKKVSTKSE